MAEVRRGVVGVYFSRTLCAATHQIGLLGHIDGVNVAKVGVMTQHLGVPAGSGQPQAHTGTQSCCTVRNGQSPAA